MPKKAVSKTQARLNEDMKRELIAIIGNMKDPALQGGLLTVTRAEVAPDQSTCKVYVSVLGGDAGTAGAVAALERAKGHVRSEIASRMHIRRSPELLFVADGSAEYADHINKLLKEL